MIARILNTREEIDQARNLLYRSYYEIGGWDPVQPNPSGIYLDHKRKLFTDDYDFITTWFGVIHNGEVVACLRANIAPEKFEIENYRSIPEILKINKSAEINRWAVDERYQKTTPAVLMLFRTYTISLYKMGVEYKFGGSIVPWPASWLIKIGMTQLEENTFKYLPDDKDEALLLAGRIGDRHNLACKMLLLSLLIRLKRNGYEIEPHESYSIHSTFLGAVKDISIGIIKGHMNGPVKVVFNFILRRIQRKLGLKESRYAEIKS